MTKCNECGKDMSTTAAACPACGAKPKKKTSMLTWIAAGMAAIIVVSCIGSNMNSGEQREVKQRQVAAIEAAKSPQQKASEAAAAAYKDAELQFAISATRMTKASMKNPSSFEFVDASLVDKGALCLKYRGTNSFNAVTTEQVAISRSMKKGDWNKDCAGRKVTDMSAISAVL